MDNWCPEVYRSLFVDRFNSDKIFVAPCCQAYGELESVDTFDFATSPTLQALRAKFDQGLKPQECERCWSMEAVGHKSRRQSAIEFFGIEPNNQVQLQSIDNAATWACNSACIMCGPYNSSMWATELELSKDELTKLGRYFQKNNQFLNKLDTSNLRKLHFNGGEPMLNNDQLSLLDHLDQQGVLPNLFVSYNTNGTVIPDQRLVDYWSRCGLVKILYSIDATESAFEYIRWPGRWEQLSNNVAQLKHTLLPNVMFGVNITVGSYNVLELPELWSWFVSRLSTNREGDASDFCWQLVHSFDVKNLPAEARQQAVEQLQYIPAFSGLIPMLETDVEPDYTWTQTLDAIDRRRKTNWKASLKIGAFFKD